jgi:predicted Zn-dependent protease
MNDPTRPARSRAADPALACASPGRRRFTAGLLGLGATAAVPAWAREGVEVGRESPFARLVSEDDIEQAATQQYQQLLAEARSKQALAGPNDPQLVRLRAIAQRLIPHTYDWNPRARNWQWEVNLIGSKEINAFCMPGGKIAFFYGLLQQLQLSDDQVAMVMGHEMTHALREHGRAQIGQQAATRLGVGLVSSLFGLGSTGQTLLNIGSQLWSLKFSRADESEADLIGMEIAARAGYDPRTAVTLWQKMMGANTGEPPAILSDHPSSPTRLRDIEANLPRVMPLYERADKPDRRFGPPPQPAGH